MVNDNLIDHEYDGIREYDNPCPGWWHLIFWGTVVFSAFYFVFFQMGDAGWTLDDSYKTALSENVRLRFAEIGELKPDEATLLKYMAKPDWVAVGGSVFATNCQSCHAADGSGLVGPNLTDEYYKNVKQLADIPKVVADGAASGSMPAWRNRLHPNEIVLVSAFVAGLRGKNLPSSRGAEGEKIPPWPAAAAAAPADAAKPAAKPAESGAAK
jgi:cytochrome c oxidase cbb3-type subunit III